MSLFVVLRIAFGALAANRARSALTVLSITVGAFAIVVMSSLAESGLTTLQRGIEELGGGRILFIIPKTPARGEAKQFAYSRGFTLTDRERMSDGVPHVASLSLFTNLGEKEVIAESGARAIPSVVAADADFFGSFKLKLGRGRAFTDEENRARASLCVIGYKLAETIGPTPNQALGGFLTVGGLRCRIAGVLAKDDHLGLNFGFDWTDLVIAPNETMGDVDPSVRMGASMFVKTDDPTSNEVVKRLINARLSARHPGVDDFTILDFSSVMTNFKSVVTGMELLVALLAGIALFVGGVGVMNMMLVAVSERVKEIGIRKALGAPPRAIGAQFLAEAVVLSMLGGGTGVTLGLVTAIGAAAIIRRALTSWQLSLAPWATVSALVVTMAIGLGFGWLPAKKAAALAPVDAMRQ